MNPHFFIILLFFSKILFLLINEYKNVLWIVMCLKSLWIDFKLWPMLKSSQMENLLLVQTNLRIVKHAAIEYQLRSHS
jgi:hypothetical protein